jgi:protein-disulfide isomerase
MSFFKFNYNNKYDSINYMKSYIWMGGVVIVLVVLMFLGVRGTPGTSLSFEPGVISPSDNVEGNVKSPVVIIEYSDFECPACRFYYMVTKQLIVEFGDEVAFVYRNFPLIEIHPNAEAAARAAQAAGKQGKFWEMHNLLFEKQDEWAKAADPEPLFESYATLLNISMGQFKTDIVSKEVTDLVRAERASAIKLKLQGTPTFFINGKKLDENPGSVEAFRAIISDAIKSKA